MRLFFGLLLSLASAGHCARILAILPVPVKSHYVVMEPLLQALAARGHQLTVFSSFPQKALLANFTDIDCSQGMPLFLSNQNYSEIRHFGSNPFTHVPVMLDVMSTSCESYYRLPVFDSIKNNKFDLVISEMFAGDCFIHFAYTIGVPQISIVTMPPLPWTPDNFGLPDNPAYIPNSLVNVPPVMNLYQRIYNTISVMYAKVVFHLSSSPRTQRTAEEYFQERLPWAEDVARNSSLLLVNSHPAVSQSRPLPPNVVEVGGLHIKEKQPLPPDIQDILDNSPHGVVLMSFGSILRVSSIPQKILNIILSAFSKVPQTILIKYEDNLTDCPKNVITRSWLPQRDILEHKNVMAFISHCGMASVMEAVHFAKPVLGVPVFSDQYLNINTLAWRGAGIAVDLDTVTDKEFENALDQIINNNTIREGMKRLSAQFRDRPMSALQSAVYWTEYVLRHRGAPRLRPASTSLSFYQRWLLDVIAVLVAALVAACCAAYVTAKHIISFTKSRVYVRPESVKKDD